MIDERHEELASLYALDLLEGAERAAFERTLAADSALQALVAELRNASTSLAHTAPAVRAPAALKDRIFATIDRAAPAPAPAPDNIIRPNFVLWHALPWAAAACFGLCAIWFGQGYLAERAESANLRTREALAEATLKSSLQQLEAERIVNRQRFAEDDQKLAAANANLGTLRTQLAARNQEVGTLSARIAALASDSSALAQQLGDAAQQIARLTTDLKTQGDLARYQITALVSMIEGSPKSIAAAVWDPAKQEGVLKVENLPALAANEDYQLWIVDPRYPNPVDGGVFTVDPQTGARSVSFKSKQPVQAINAFAVTRERKGGVPKAEGPFVLLGK